MSTVNHSESDVPYNLVKKDCLQSELLAYNKSDSRQKTQEQQIRWFLAPYQRNNQSTGIITQQQAYIKCEQNNYFSALRSVILISYNMKSWRTALWIACLMNNGIIIRYRKEDNWQKKQFLRISFSSFNAPKQPSKPLVNIYYPITGKFLSRSPL